METFALNSTFVVLDPAFGATPVTVGPTLYQDIDRDFAGFRGCMLVSEHAFDSDWPTWERHPAGDEVLYLVEGHARLHILSDGTERVVELKTPGQVAIVPRGCWHTARTATRTRIVFVTPGEGTENIADPRVAAVTAPA